MHGPAPATEPIEGLLYENRASLVTLEHILEHRAVRRQVGDQTLELSVLVLQLLQVPDFRRAHDDQLLLSAVKR